MILIILNLFWLHAESSLPEDCPNTLDLQWNDAVSRIEHNYTFSFVEFNEKAWPFYEQNGRPPLKEVFFIQRLPPEQRSRFDELCFPASIVSDSIAAEAELLTSRNSTELSLWLSETLYKISSFPSNYLDVVGRVWPIVEALTRIRDLVVASDLTPVTAKPTVALVVCHCRESLDWLIDAAKNVPDHTRLLIYEKCGMDSILTLAKMEIFSFFTGGVWVIPQPDGKVRGDECTAYLQYITHMYSNLPSYTVFLQADADHHLFFPYLWTALGGIKSGRYEVPFLHLNFHRHYQTTTPCMRDVERVIFDYDDDFRVESLPLIGTYCCAQFIVSKDRILARDLDFYHRALSLVNGSVPDICSPEPPARSSHCYVLEYVWHIIFGEDRFLPFKPDDKRLPIALRAKYGNESAKTRWDDVQLAKDTGRVLNKTIDC